MTASRCGLMPRRFLGGIGVADLTPEQDVLARRILADQSLDRDDAAAEVATLHALAVYLDAKPAIGPDGEDTWADERAQAELEMRGDQLGLVA